MKKILVVEDDPNIAKLIELYLTREGYRVLISGDGLEALELAQKSPMDMVILDRMLPGMEGLSVLAELRKSGNVPVIVLSAKSDEMERIIGLEVGADDYVCKPFSPKELVSRVKALFRRSDDSGVKGVVDLIEHGGICLNGKTRNVKVDGASVELSAHEFDLLSILAAEPGRVFTRDQLLKALYGGQNDMVFDRTIDAHIKNLRKKLGDSAKTPKWIGSVFGVGYKLIDHETSK